jgi:hypothetical protein
LNYPQIQKRLLAKKHPCDNSENWTLVHLEDLKSFEIKKPMQEKNTLGWKVSGWLVQICTLPPSQLYREDRRAVEQLGA